MRQRQWQGKPRDNHETCHEVAKVQKAAIVVGGKVVGTGAACAEAIW